MDTTALLVVIAIVLPVITLGVWGWTLVRRIDRQLAEGFEGIHFE